MACAAIGLVALIFGVLKIRVSKETQQQPHVIRDTAAECSKAVSKLRADAE